MPRKARPKKPAQTTPTRTNQQRRDRAFLRVVIPIALTLLLLGLAAMALLHWALGWPWSLPIVRAVMLVAAFAACVGVMAGSALLCTPTRRRLVWGCAAWSLLAVTFLGLWTYATWPRGLLLNSPWLSCGITGAVCAVLVVSGLRAMGWPLHWAAWRQGAVDGWRSDVARLPTGSTNPRLSSTLLAVLGFGFSLWALHGVTRTVLYAVPQQAVIVAAPLTKVLRRTTQSRGGGGVVTRWTVVLPTAHGVQPIEFDRKALFERHEAMTDHDDDPHSPGRNCLFRSVQAGDVLTLRVRQHPLWGTAIDQLIGINGPSGPPCVTTNKPIKE